VVKYYFLLKSLVKIIKADFCELKTDLYADYFSGNYEVYYTFWNVYWSLGFGLQFAWSSLLCVRVKTYIMIGALFTTVVVAGTRCFVKR